MMSQPFPTVGLPRHTAVCPSTGGLGRRFGIPELAVSRRVRTRNLSSHALVSGKASD